MRLAFVEAEGFRGFHDKVRIDFAPGFTVVTGRNGVGKSTIFDAVEFAITGTINKYKVDRSGTDKLEDYIWWRGDVPPSGYYVKVGFVDDEGKSHEVYRDRSGEATRSEAIEATLCTPIGKPADALRHLCQTSIIRDELITSLSFDLSEGDRFSLVYDAQGVVGGPDYERRAQDIQTAVKQTAKDCERVYSESRARLNQSLAELATAKDRASKAGDAGSALALIDGELKGAPEAIAAKLTAARSALTERRLRLSSVGRLAEEERSFLTAREAAERSSPESLRVKREEERARLEALAKSASSELEEARRQLETEERQNELATSLAELLKHGERLGLHDGSCPLCAAARTDKQFVEGLHTLQTRLQNTGSNIQKARARLDKAQSDCQAISAQLRKCLESVNDFEAQQKAFAEREATLLKNLREAGVVLQGDRLGITQEYVVRERSRLIDFERAILTVEASRSIDQVAELEVRCETLRKDAELAADRVAKTKRAQEAARDLEHAVDRARLEVSDERLASLKPVLTEFYQRLRPHSDWRTIRYSIRGDVTRLLSLRVGEDINPQFVFSSGQRRAAGLAFLFAVHVSRPWCLWQSLLLDDPVQHIDDFRSLHLVEVLAALGTTGRQIICGVEDAALADLMCRRLLGSSASDGLRYDLERVAGGSTRVFRLARVPPMLRGTMRQASGAAIAG